MSKVFLGFCIVFAVLVASCAQSYTVGVLLAPEAGKSPAVLGKTEFVDALKRMRKDAKNTGATLVPRWMVRRVPKALCEREAGKQADIDERDKKKLTRIVRAFSTSTRVVIDYTCEAGLEVLSPLYAQNNVRVVSPYGWGLKVRQPQNAAHVLSTAIAPDAEPHAMLRFLSARGIANVGLVHDGTRYSSGLTDVFMNIAGGFGVDVAFNARVLPNGRGVSRLVRGLQPSDALVYVGVRGAAFVRQARAAGFLKTIVLPSFAAESRFLSQLGTRTDEVYLVDRENLVDGTSWGAFELWFKSHYAGFSPTRVVTEAYVALEVALYLARRGAQGVEQGPGTLSNARIPTLFGQVYFDAQNAMRGVYRMYEVKNSSFVPYWD